MIVRFYPEHRIFITTPQTCVYAAQARGRRSTLCGWCVMRSEHRLRWLRDMVPK